MNAEDKIQAAFQELGERTEWIDATRNQAPSAVKPVQNQPKMPRRPMMALAAAVMVVGGGAAAINALTNDTQAVETGPTDSTQVEGTETTVPADDSGDTDEVAVPDDSDNSGSSGDGSSDGDGQLLTPEGVGGFTSPSGNIACNLSTFGVSCWIGDKEWEIEQPQGEFCDESDWGNAVDVNTDIVYFPCYTDFGWPIDAEPLAYGDRMRVGEFECLSAEQGVTCTNGSGDGFRLSRSEVIVFPEDGQNEQPSVGTVQHDRFAVLSERVAADTEDPFLNVRDAASTAGNLVAKLPPDYTGLIATGRSETLASGAEWIEVRLIDPVEALSESNAGGYPVGWVNAALVVPLVDGLSISADQLPPCSGDAVAGASGALDTGYVYGLEHAQLTNTCHRVILSFGAGTAPVLGGVSGDGARSSTVPSVSLDGAGRSDIGVTIDLGQTDDAWFAASDTRTSGGVFLVRGEDNNLDVVTTFPVGDVTITALADQGRLVIDLESDGAVAPNGNGVALLSRPEVAAGTVSIAGVARPFESVLDASIEDGAGQAVEATFTGSGPFGEQRTTGYGVTASDWTVAWGLFDLTIEDLEPGDYTIVLNGGASGDPADMFRYDVTIP